MGLLNGKKAKLLQKAFQKFFIRRDADECSLR
jgi:hypothetical protein